MSTRASRAYPVATPELRDILETVLSRHSGARRRVRGLRRRVSAYASSSRIEELDVVLDHGKRLELVAKDLSPAARLDAARGVRPAFLYDPLREAEMYRAALADAGLGTPVCYGSVCEAASGRCLLFLERVRGPLLWQVGGLKAWEQSAAWLARMHSRLRPSSLRAPIRDRLLAYDEDYYRTWPRRAEAFLRAKAAPSRLRAPLHRLLAGYDRVVDHLAALPRTVIHGEFYPSNVLLRADRERRRTCPIDWELAARGPGLMDVAALMSGNWSDAQKRGVVRAYRAALEPRRGSPPSLAELEESLAYCQLHLAVQMLGWARGWTPPAPHRQDWLETALQLATRLGVR